MMEPAVSVEIELLFKTDICIKGTTKNYINSYLQNRIVCTCKILNLNPQLKIKIVKINGQEEHRNVIISSSTYVNISSNSPSYGGINNNSFIISSEIHNIISSISSTLRRKVKEGFFLIQSDDRNGKSHILRYIQHVLHSYNPMYCDCKELNCSDRLRRFFRCIGLQSPDILLLDNIDHSAKSPEKSVSSNQLQFASMLISEVDRLRGKCIVLVSIIVLSCLSHITDGFL